MRLVRLEGIILYKILGRTTLPDGERTEQLDEGTSYQALIEYLDDEVAAATYGADITKVQRICTINNVLEKSLLPKVHNNDDNISKYIIEYKNNKFSILRVTPRYIDIKWR